MNSENYLSLQQFTGYFSQKSPYKPEKTVLIGRFQLRRISHFRAFEKIEMNVELYLHHYQMRELDDAFDFQSSIVPVLDEKLQPIW